MKLPENAICYSQQKELPPGFTGVGFCLITNSFHLFYEGLLHCNNGPAIFESYEPLEKRKNKGEFWYLNGLAHRIGGPAFTYSDGITQEYYIYGESFTEEEYWLIPINLESKLNRILDS